MSVKLLPIADRHHDRVFEIAKELEDMGMRVEVDDRNEKIGYKIREAQVQKIPYMVIIGDKDIENDTVSIRHRKDGDLGSMSLNEFKDMMREEIDTKAIK